MHPEDIKALLRKKGRPPATVARDLRVSPGTVSNVIHGRHTSHRIATHIAGRLGIPVSKLWPGRYPRLELAELKAA